MRGALSFPFLSFPVPAEAMPCLGQGGMLPTAPTSKTAWEMLHFIKSQQDGEGRQWGIWGTASLAVLPRCEFRGCCQCVIPLCSAGRIVLQLMQSWCTTRDCACVFTHGGAGALVVTAASWQCRAACPEALARKNREPQSQPCQRGCLL